MQGEFPCNAPTHGIHYINSVHPAAAKTRHPPSALRPPARIAAEQRGGAPSRPRHLSVRVLNPLLTEPLCVGPCVQGGGFSEDPKKGLNEGWTVTYWSLQVLWWVGCQEVYIIGMDHNFQQTGPPNQEQKMVGEVCLVCVCVSMCLGVGLSAYLHL